MSLREAEAKIKQHTEEKFKLYNFLRPSKRDSIQRTVDYFQEVKRTYKRSSPPRAIILIGTLARPRSNTTLLPRSGSAFERSCSRTLTPIDASRSKGR
jgi:hypothetical protein